MKKAIYLLIAMGIILTGCQGNQKTYETQDSIYSEKETIQIGVTLASDSAAYQIKLAEYMMAKAAGEDHNIELEIVYGNWDANDQTSQMDAFIRQKKDAIILCPINAIIVGIGSGDWDQDKAYRVACDLLRKNKDLDFIYAHDSHMAMGAVKAVEEAGRSDSVRVIGIGEGDEYTEAVEAGRLYGFIVQNAEYEAAAALTCALAAACGEDLRPWYKNPVKKITIENQKMY